MLDFLNKEMLLLVHYKINTQVRQEKIGFDKKHLAMLRKTKDLIEEMY